MVITPFSPSIPDKYVGDFEQLLTAMRGMRDAMVHTIR